MEFGVKKVSFGTNEPLEHDVMQGCQLAHSANSNLIYLKLT